MFSMIKMLIIPFVYFCLLNTVNVYYSKKTFGFCLPITFVVSTLVLFFSQYILHTFFIGMYLLIATCLFGAVLLFKNIKSNESFRKNILSNGFYAFVVVYAIFYVINFKRLFSVYDEFSHWGWFVRDMFENNRFYCENVVDSFAHKEYPPFFPIFELQWNYIINEFSESATTLALHAFEFSVLVCPISEKLKTEKIVNKLLNPFLLLACFTPIVVIFDADNVFNGIYVDYAIPLFYVYIMLMLVNEKEYLKNNEGLACFFLLLFALSLMKQISVAYILLILFYFFFTYNKKLLPIVLLSPALGLVLWKIKTINIIGQFDLSLDKITNSFINDNGFIESFFNSLIQRNVTYGVIQFSFTSVSIILVFVLAAMTYKKKTHDRKMILIITILGTIGYSLLMYVIYATSFPQTSWNILPSYKRFFGSFIAGEIIMLFSVIICENNNLNYILIAISLLSVLISSDAYTSVAKVAPQCLTFNSNAYKYRCCYDDIKEINEKIVVYCLEYGREEIEFYSRNKDNIKYCGYEKNVEKLNNTYVYVIDFSDTVNKVFNTEIETNKVVYID